MLALQLEHWSFVLPPRGLGVRPELQINTSLKRRVDPGCSQCLLEQERCQRILKKLLKEALLHPLNKWPSQNATKLDNYYPVSNLSFWEKKHIILNVVGLWVREGFRWYGLSRTLQSRFTTVHEVETAWLTFMNTFGRAWMEVAEHFCSLRSFSEFPYCQQWYSSTLSMRFGCGRQSDSLPFWVCGPRGWLGVCIEVRLTAFG